VLGQPLGGEVGRVVPAASARLAAGVVAQCGYERFRPQVPEGVEGWGARAVLDIGRIRKAAG
jgi:hypothetical protein